MAGNLVITGSETYNFGGLSIGGATSKYSASDSRNFDDTLAAPATDLFFAYGVNVALSVVQGIEANQDATVKTYDGQTLKQTLTLKANKPLFYNPDKEDSMKVFTDSFDSIKVTTTVANTRLKIGMALNTED